MQKTTFAASHAEQAQMQSGEIIIGKITSIDAAGAFVSHPKNPGNGPLLAISTVAIDAEHIGRDVALLFHGGDLTKPVIMGLIHSPVYDLPDVESTGEDLPEVLDTQRLEITADGELQTIEAKEELILKCGKASIGLRKDGRIQIRGSSITTRSTGKNRILGASISLN